MRRLLEWYDRRIVNVNVNIVAAGLLALIPTTIAAHAARHWLDITNSAAITAVTFIADAVADVAVYYALHWLANHMPRSTPRLVRSAAYGGMSFVKDATLVQFERACLSPLLYVIALGGQWLLMNRGVGVAGATVIGFASAIALTRVLHTIWMYRAELRAQEAQVRALQDRAAADSPAPR